jgi:hypothetical protein
MSLRYSHTLICTSPEFTPTAAQVQTFLTGMVERGVMGGEPALKMRTPSDRIREVRNPFTGATEVWRIMDHTNLASVSGVAGAVATLKEFWIEISGSGRPRNPPLPVDLKDDYYVGVTCVISPEVRSTSDLHEESESALELPFHGRPCQGRPKRGYFSNPYTMEIIEVRGAGCARFWIEFQLGNNLFPKFDTGNLNLLDVAIVKQAANIFKKNFAQGCVWG